MGNGASTNSQQITPDPLAVNKNQSAKPGDMPKATTPVNVSTSQQKGPVQSTASRTPQKLSSSGSAAQQKNSDSQQKNSDSQQKNRESQQKNSDLQQKNSGSQQKNSGSQQKNSDSQQKNIGSQQKNSSSQQKNRASQPKPANDKVNETIKAGKTPDDGPSSSTKMMTPQSQSADKENAHSSKKQRHKLYFPTVDDLVFETFYHRDGHECECMYMNGQRFYLDSWNSKEWQVFPMKWYDEGMLITNSIINDKEQDPIALDQATLNKEKKTESNAEVSDKVSDKVSDDREGWIKHPKRGKIPTYIFEEKHNVHCFFDLYSGMWLRLPMGWELLHDTVNQMVATVETAIPSWKDRYEMLAMLRACNYNPDECISNYLQIEGDELKAARNSGDAKALHAKDQQLSDLQKKLKDTEHRLNAEIKAKDEAKNRAADLQTRLSAAEAEMQSAKVQLDSLQQSRPKTARPKTPQVTVINKVSEDDLMGLMKKTKEMNEAFIQLKMDADRWMDDMRTTVTMAVQTSTKLKMVGSDHVKQLEEVRSLYRKEAFERRRLYNQLQEVRGNIRVFLRCRKDKNISCCMKFPTDQDVDIPGAAGGKKRFQFDKVFEPGASQEQVFEDTMPIIACCADGYNVCIMAYGQTGSGKTYTMMGPTNNPGVNIRSITELLRICKERVDTVSYVIKISILEIYNETVQDLLTSDAGTLEVRAQGNQVTIPGIAVMEVETLEDIERVMKMGDENRSVASTKMNSTSSRSHLVMIVSVTGTDKVTGAQSLGRLMLCDLAGSERIKKSEAEGQRLVEAAAINKSLSALGQVFGALRSKQLHIPYRNSKLTHILQPALGGEAKACLFVNVSPDENNLTESLSTLQFGSNARQIQLGQAKQNVIKPNTLET